MTARGPGAAGLSEQQRDTLRAQLESELERAAARAAGLARSFADIVESSAIAPPDDEHDPEGSTVAFERAQVSALLADARRQRDELALARRRLDEGAYGICERCGEAIADDRLLARPAARRCVACAATASR